MNILDRELLNIVYQKLPLVEFKPEFEEKHKFNAIVHDPGIFPYVCAWIRGSRLEKARPRHIRRRLIPIFRKAMNLPRMGSQNVTNQ
jgi:hypothetical protein